MSDIVQEERFDRRVKQRLQSRYVRWLARNKPNTFFYRDSWRGFQRSYRRISNLFWRLFDVKLPDWVLFALGGPILIVMAGAVVAAVCVFTSLYFLSPPSDIEQLSIEDQVSFGFFRLAVIQFAALISFILIGVTVRNSLGEERGFKNVMPGDRRRAQVGMIQLFAGVIVAISWFAAFVVSFDLPSYGYAVLATGLSGTILFWSLHWVSRWLGIVEIPWEGKGGEGLAIGISAILCLAAFLFALIPKTVEHVQRLNWLLPTGWLNEQAREIGEGNLARAWLLVGGWGIVLAIGFIARGQTKTWWHRRRVLRRGYAVPFASKPSRKRKEFALSDIPADFRRRLRSLPARWYTWLLPDWIRRAFVLLAAVTAFCLLLQSIAYSLHTVISQLAEPTEPSERINDVLFSATIIVMTLTIESCGLLVQDRILRYSFEQQPISPWGLWRRLQFSGLLRLPMTFLLILPLLIVPTIVKQGDPTMPLAMLGLGLSACFAIRTLVVAVIAQQGIYREVHELIATPCMLLVMGLGFGMWLLILRAIVLDFPGIYPLVWRQLAVHGGSMMLLLIASRVWSFTPWLARGASAE